MDIYGNEDEVMTIILNVIELTRPGVHNRYIRFDLDDGKLFCYRSRISHGAFHSYKHKRNRNGQYVYLSKHMKEFQGDVATWAKMMAKHPALPDIYSNVPVVTVKNLWEFYKLVGYDYKRKKWS